MSVTVRFARRTLVVFAFFSASPVGMAAILPETEAWHLYTSRQSRSSSAASAAVSTRVVPTSRDRFESSFLNPFLARDLGLAASVSDIPESAYAEVISWLAHGSHGEQATVTYRRRRDGRSIYLGYGVAKTFYFAGSAQPPALVRILQKGDLATGMYGDHSDGHFDAVGTMSEMVVGEILYRHGLNTARGLFGSSLKGIKRMIDPRQENAPSAGVGVRIGERLRFADGPSESYFNLADLEAPVWAHPLIVGGLDALPVAKRQQVVATMNEAMLHDLWALHGSLTLENRSDTLIDLSTLSFLSEPNPGAQISGAATNFWDETKISIGTPSSRFYDTFAFHQLRRLGLPDAEILSAFFVKTVETMGSGEFIHYRARPEAVDLAEAILNLDQFTAGRPTPFKADVNDRASTTNRVIFNTRKILKEMVDARWYQREFLTENDAMSLLNAARFAEFHDDNPLDGPLKHTRAGKIAATQNIHRAIRLAASFIEGDIDTVQAAAALYSSEQTLPLRASITAKVEEWFRAPLSFLPDFIHYIESTDAPALQKAIRDYYQEPQRTPLEDKQTIIRRFETLMNPCFRLNKEN